MSWSCSTACSTAPCTGPCYRVSCACGSVRAVRCAGAQRPPAPVPKVEGVAAHRYQIRGTWSPHVRPSCIVGLVYRSGLGADEGGKDLRICD
eukprot:4334466-Prymnesium_polylepis.1